MESPDSTRQVQHQEGRSRDRSTQTTDVTLPCIRCGRPASAHAGGEHHIELRGMGGRGDKAPPTAHARVPLCRECHELKTLGRIETEVGVHPEEGLSYRWRKKGADVWVGTRVEVSQRYKCLVGRLSDGAELEGKPESPPNPFPSAPSLKEESDGEPNRQEANVPPLQDAPEDNDVLAGHGTRDLPPVRSRARGSVRPERAEGVGKHEHSSLTHEQRKEESEGRAPNNTHSRIVGGSRTDSDGAERGSAFLTHEQRVAIAKEIHDTEWNRQWIAGDTANQWREELGEEAEQYISDFGYVQESIANIMRVCEAIPKNLRRARLRFSHHVVMLGLNREDMDMWLDKCE
ncbi:hypothetical protein LCGC14_2435310, partial [marine sediment metagenome]